MSTQPNHTIMLADNSRSEQAYSISPSSGEIGVLNNQSSNTFNNVSGVTSGSNKVYSKIAEDGEVEATVAPKGTSSKSIFSSLSASDIGSQIIVGVIVAVISAYVIVTITRRK